ncbi:hypothetical protein [Candidatus Similichlamydia epinepheli]|uniref:hypothetical protein n=1 Tax=Candidatus Similichlamydia epinepheli TaxID=1903953 RepID=UPI000D3A1ADB|nr:hypothetical protein [Candidatus Similichlamydia epinepheli]
MHEELIGFFSSLKETDITDQEIQLARNDLFQEARDVMTSSAQEVAQRVFDSIKMNFTAPKIDMKEQSEVRGIPYHALNIIHIPSITKREVNQAMLAWSHAPLEVLLIKKDSNSSTDQVVKAFLPLWKAHLPKTNDILCKHRSHIPMNGSARYFSCDGSTSEVVPIFVVNLGKICPRSILAAELICSKLPLQNKDPSFVFDCEWGPCAGCTLVMVKVDHMLSAHTFANNMDRSCMLKKTITEFEDVFLTQFINQEILEPWDRLLIENAEKKNFHEPHDMDIAFVANSHLEWLTNMFESELCFFEITDIVSDEQKKQILLCEALRVIKNSLSLSRKCWDMWNFVGPKTKV